MEPQNLEQYKQYVKEKLEALTPIFANAAIGDFSTSIEIPDQDDEFAQLYVGIRIMLDVVNDHIKHLEQRVREQTETLRSNLIDIDKFKAIIQESSEGICLADGSRDHLFVYVNPAWEAMTGWMSQEAVGKLSPRILKSGKQDDAFYKNLWETIGAKKVFRSEIINKRKDGTLYDAEIVIFSVIDASGKQYYAEIARNIGERKQLEQQMREYNMNLEQRVAQATAQLQEKVHTLERINKVMVGRELKMIELKKELETLHGANQQRAQPHTKI